MAGKKQKATPLGKSMLAAYRNGASRPYVLSKLRPVLDEFTPSDGARGVSAEVIMLEYGRWSQVHGEAVEMAKEMILANRQEGLQALADALALSENELWITDPEDPEAGVGQGEGDTDG